MVIDFSIMVDDALTPFSAVFDVIDSSHNQCIFHGDDPLVTKTVKRPGADLID